MPFVGAAGSGEVQRARWSVSMADRVKSVANSSVSGCGWRREWQRSYPFRTDDRGCRGAPKRSRLRRRSFCSPACATSASTSAPTVPARDRSGRRASSSIIAGASRRHSVAEAAFSFAAQTTICFLPVSFGFQLNLTVHQTRRIRLPTGNSGRYRQNLPRAPWCAARHSPRRAALRPGSIAQATAAAPCGCP